MFNHPLIFQIKVGRVILINSFLVISFRVFIIFKLRHILNQIMLCLVFRDISLHLKVVVFVCNWGCSLVDISVGGAARPFKVIWSKSALVNEIVHALDLKGRLELIFGSCCRIFKRSVRENILDFLDGEGRGLRGQQLGAPAAKLGKVQRQNFSCVY